MGSSFQILGHEFRSDSFLCFRLGRRQRNEEVVKRGSSSSGTTPFESLHKKNRKSSPDAVQKQSCMQHYWERQMQRVSR